MVILECFFCFPANLEVGRILSLLFSFSELKVSQIHWIFFPLDQEEGAKIFDSKSTLFIKSRFDRKQYTHVQSLLTFLFSGAVSYSSSRTVRNYIKYIVCHFFSHLKLDFGVIRMIWKSINWIQAVHVMRFQPIFLYDLWSKLHKCYFQW